MINFVPVKRALVSVSDKTGLVEMARMLEREGVEIVSTGGTAEALRSAGLNVLDVAEITGFPEIMDGRVKTLHPTVHGGLLAKRDNDEHLDAMAKSGILPIDLLICNLYPFERTVAAGESFDNCIENIDIGGPAMIRAAAKNHQSVAVIVDPSDYDQFLKHYRKNDGSTSLSMRRWLAATAYARTAAYDSEISNWISKEVGNTEPKYITFSGSRPEKLRYGENPHQAAILYKTTSHRPGVGAATQLQGKELSYNNYNDTDAAFELVSEFEEPAAAIIKHANPCGVAVSTNLLDAYKNALVCDKTSAYGGIVAVNTPLQAEVAKEISKIFTEVVIAPSVEMEAKKILLERKNLRVLETGGVPNPEEPSKYIKPIAGGFLLQDGDSARIKSADLRVVTEREPTKKELSDLLVAFSIAKHVKSNAIVYVKNGASVGIGAGQMSRIDASRIAAIKAKEASAALGLIESMTVGSVVASDAFFPFADGLLAAIKAGATAVIQPGGSVRDQEVIDAANENNIAMIMTGIRNFRH
ncbi:MAG: bifunctional phosphoribosylaminoimidazolecarboxamide formyltransferase/inosine monophosphate cyclohydrolase [Rhodospirillaceae bacterium]|nr:bifunctional phosphoribosylaminoimidazolecarboxamide formyltransferase/inosine monophosphate cyclohydrolase [Rhodospirillaceae bacterium]